LKSRACGYRGDLDRAILTIQDVLQANDLVLDDPEKNPEPEIFISALADSGIESHH
jgi:hypothetical protein